MRIAFFDTVAGIAGDMTLASFLSAGLPLEDLRADLALLDLGGYDLSVRHVRRNAIDAVQVTVDVTAPTPLHQTLEGILQLLARSALPQEVKNRAEVMFRIIAEAEAHVHGTTVDRVHFHEIGAVDSIVDVVGTAICLERLGIERVYSTPVRLGSGGTVQTQHGVMPVPAPAALEILRGYPVVFTSLPHELTTPTGAAIIRAFSSGILDEEQIEVTDVGYGAGSRDIAEIPNLLRLAVGTLFSGIERDRVTLVETNIDDMNPQLYPVVIERLLAAGALDVYLVPIIMKKGRPGVLLSALADRSALGKITAILYRETSTIGLRISDVDRRKLARRQLEIHTRFGAVRVKEVLRNGQEIRTPEFEECRRIAEEHGLPVLEVMRRLEQDLNKTDPQPAGTP
jgi:uncharacterized protein (TIGR00299 family) protein